MKLLPSCKDVTDLSSDYLDHNLSIWKRIGFWIHIMMCVHCKRYVDQLRLTIAAITKSPAAQLPEVDKSQVDDIAKNLRDICKHHHHS